MHFLVLALKDREEKYSLMAHFSDLKLCRIGSGRITILLGTSTAGKTSIIKNMLNMKEGLVDHSLDNMISDKIGVMFKEFDLELYTQLTKYVNPNRINGILFGDNVAGPDELQNAIIKARSVKDAFLAERDWRAIFNDMYEDIIESSVAGKDVVFDTVIIQQLEDFMCKNFKAPIRIVLIFCPLINLTQRILQRNIEAEESGAILNKRHINHFLQYSRLYCQRQNKSAPLLEEISKKDALQAIETFSNDSEQQTKFLESLGLDEKTEKVEITSRWPHISDEYVINSSRKAPVAIARMLI
jgi:hypothetical protein